MRTKTFYVAPEIVEFEMATEGLLCQSPDAETGAGAGELDDNSWILN